MALIMLAEDAPDIVELLKDFLEARGHQVVYVMDGVQMVVKAKEWRPHLLIADLMMPGAYGSAAARSLLEDPFTSRIPIIFLTAVPPEKAQRVVPTGPNIRLLHKPVNLPELSRAINEMIALSRGHAPGAGAAGGGSPAPGGPLSGGPPPP